jgi:hypothetical protein
MGILTLIQMHIFLSLKLVIVIVVSGFCQENDDKIHVATTDFMKDMLLAAVNFSYKLSGCMNLYLYPCKTNSGYQS